VRGGAGHPGEQGGGLEKNNWKKMEGQGRGEAQGVADQNNFLCRYHVGDFTQCYFPQVYIFY
jgi:hypothetical protein